ncbi:MAG: NUDIX hydrolase [Candidatus Saccharimonadales bacterium]
MSAQVVIVDQQDNPIGLKNYADLRYEDIYQVSALWLTDIDTGDVLMTQRKWAKHNDPGKWMAAASGTIEEGEDYDRNIVHEIEEEIGLTDLKLTRGPKEYTDDGTHKYFVQWYLAEVNKNEITVKIQEEEVEAYEWVPLDKLTTDLKANPGKYVPSLAKDMKTLGVLHA